MSLMPKCQALHIVSRVCDISILTKYPYNNVKLLDICGFIASDKFLYETRVLDNSYLRFKVQLLTSHSTEITAGASKITLEGPVPLDALTPSGKIYLYLTRVLYHI